MIWEFDGNSFSNCVVFFRVGEPWGGLSNMSNAWPLRLGSLRIPSSEALYQACRYPHRPEWQREILAAPHAMRAKMASKKQGRQAQSRPDWEEIKLEVMRWCLQLKLEQHFGRFYHLLKSSGCRPIVERSRRDRFWGAVLEEDGVLRGENRLGQLLAELRNQIVAFLEEEQDCWFGAEPPEIVDFRLLGRDICEQYAEIA